MTLTRECKACDGRRVTFTPGPGYSWCEACQRTGSIIDHIPASDAIADAETLRVNAVLTDERIYQAKAIGLQYARRSARAAFRAVPALKGE